MVLQFVRVALCAIPNGFCDGVLFTLYRRELYSAGALLNSANALQDSASVLRLATLRYQLAPARYN